MASGKKPQDSEDDFTREVSEAFSGQLWVALKKREKLSKTDLKKESFLKDHKRTETTKKLLHYGIIGIISFGFLFLLVAGFSFLIHLLTPYSWLTDNQFDNIQNIWISVLTINTLSPWFKRHFSKNT